MTLNWNLASVPALVATAVASLMVSAPASAQCGYSSGSPQCFSFAPPPSEIGNVSENLVLRSNELKISGDIRFRARMAGTKSGVPYAEGDQIASRARVNLDYMLNEKARAFVQLNFSETWAGSDAYSDATPGNNYNGIAQAYMLVDDLLGWGETMRIGRSNFTLASGLVYGSCDYLQYPAAGTGFWFSKEFEHQAFEVFAFDNNGTLTSGATGARFVGATGRFSFENDILNSIEPWLLYGTGEGDVDNMDSWLGVTLHGAVGGKEQESSLFNWNLEYAQRDVDATNDTRDAYRLILSKDTKEMTNGVLSKVALTRTDADGAMHINPGDFNTAGLLHQYGGAWRSDLATNQLALTFEPNEKLDVYLTYLNFDAAGNDNNELDLMAGYPLAEGVHGWMGYGRDEDDREVLFAQMTMFF
ncbi:MAG: hypothetical protein H6830_12630 [Planctomycetes bacterium]|nr:hypothetical protein [Planctomycetota bacterium]HPF13028.1 hypothetical protein [Planctomycetota bacterium]HRV81816.1 hypothetical protein [Planctomycetota bacterium]